MLKRLQLAQNQERGAVLPFVALGMTALMAFAALAVDVGNVTDARRQDQTTVDAAALAAAQELGDVAAVVNTAIDFSGRNSTDGTFTLAEFDGCDGTDQPPRFTAVTGASCVSIDDSGNQVRVVLPLRSTETVFGAAVGIADFDHSAEATAALRPLGYGNVLPLGLANGASGTVCLKVGSGNVPDPECNNSASGNFGFIDFGFHGSTTLNTAEDCTGQGKNGRLANNVAAGLDHDISVWGSGVHGSSTEFDNSSGVCNTTGCPGDCYPNATTTVTGNIPTAFGLGLFAGGSFSDTYPARLQRTGADWGGGGVTTDIAGVELDDVALYEYISDDLTGADVPLSCHKSQFTGADLTLGVGDDLDQVADGVAQHLASATPPDRIVKLIERCLLHYEGQPWTDKGAFLDTSVNPAAGESPIGCSGGSDPNACEDAVFGSNTAKDIEGPLWDIQYSPRFAYVPELDLTASQLNGTTSVKFIDIKPVFLQRIFGGNCNGTSCSFIFDPGFGQTYAGNTNKAFAMKAFVIPGDMLPDRLGDSSALYDIGVNRFIQLVG